MDVSIEDMLDIINDNTEILENWENEFIESIVGLRDQNRELSDNRKDKLVEIYLKVCDR